MRVFVTTTDEHEAALLVKSREFYDAIFELTNEVRSKLKYGHDFESADEALQWIHASLWESLSIID